VKPVIAVAASVMCGRESEFHAITTAATQVHHGGRAMVVEGEPGIGKTTLLAAAAAWANSHGFRVLSCAGVQCQTTVGYAGVHELVHPILDLADALPTHQNTALLAALGLADHAPPSPLLIGVSVLGLLEEAAAAQPLMLLVDDAQWLDGSSLHVLTFIGRRLSTAPVMLLCTTRPKPDGEPARLVSLPRLQLGPVDEPTSMALLKAAVESCGEQSLSSATQRRLLCEAGGNPLAITELTKALLSHGGEAKLAPAAPLPTTRRIERAYEEQLATLPEPSRHLLALIAAGGHVAVAELIDAAHRIGLREIDLDPLERAGLVSIKDHTLQIRHPLIRSVAYQSAGPSRRSTFHRALADATHDPSRAVLHRSAAAYGPDESVAAELEDFAQQARSRGASAEAAVAWQRAAALSPSDESRIRRLVKAVEPAYQAGLTEEAISILAEVEPLTVDLDDLFDITFARFTLGVSTGRGAPTIADLLTLADRLVADPTTTPSEKYIRLLAAAAAQCRMHGLPEQDQAAVARRLQALAHTAEPRIDIALATIDETSYAQQFRRRSDRIHTAVVDDLTSVMSMGLAAESVSDLPTAQRCWDSAIRVARQMGAPAIECEALRGCARAQLVAGHLTEALISAQRAFTLASDAELPASIGAASALLARAHAWRGDIEAAQRALRIAHDHMPTDTPLLWRDDLAWATGALALCTHDYDTAFTELAKMTHDRSSRRWAIGDLTEAAVAGGHCTRITSTLDTIDREATTLGPSHVVMLLQRSRGQLAGTHHGAEHHYQAALADSHAQHLAPLEYARTQAIYGQWLRRKRRIVDARVHLAAALRTFDTRGAQEWAQRTRTELRAAGVQLPQLGSENHSAHDELTPQELHIARLAASGLTNRQIADHIYVSHRTVAAHLYKIFPKLGITSRNQLRDRIEPEGPAVTDG